MQGGNWPANKAGKVSCVSNSNSMRKNLSVGWFQATIRRRASTAIADRSSLWISNRTELVGLKFDDVQVRQGHWAIVDLVGKGGHIRTVPIPNWAKSALDFWVASAGISGGRIFRAVARTGKVWGKGLSQNVVWYVVKSCCEKAGLLHIAPHDLRRTCAKLCHSNGGEIEQIQFLLGHASIQTTERYLGCKQNLGHPVNDLFRLETNVQPEEAPGETKGPAKMAQGQVEACCDAQSQRGGAACNEIQLFTLERGPIMVGRPPVQSVRTCVQRWGRLEGDNNKAL